MSTLEIFDQIIMLVQEKKYSDIHFSTGHFPLVRDSSGEIVKIKQLSLIQEVLEVPKFSLENIQELMQRILSPEILQTFVEEFEVDSSYSHDSISRYRVNCYKDANGISIAMRSIPKEIPTLESLGLGEQIKKMCNKSKGLILMTGPTGSGKSTNLAAMIDYINSNFKKHIVTIEDPIEFVFENKLSLINQREVGIHTKSFAKAMKSCLREDPDVIMIGEMRDPETIKAAITLAETGHLVISTLHTNDTVQSIDRIIDVFPSEQQDQIRMQLSMSLIGVIAQRLLPRLGRDERIAVREILLTNDAVRNLIISGKSHQLYSIIEIGQKQGMVLMDNYLSALYKKGFISKEVLISYARDSENIDFLIQ